MKKGKQLGEYNLKITSIRVKDAGEIEINVEAISKALVRTSQR